jgi:hypothetical protein
MAPFVCQPPPCARGLTQSARLDPKAGFMAHGTWQREDGLEFLRRAFRWLEK